MVQQPSHYAQEAGERMERLVQELRLAIRREQLRTARCYLALVATFGAERANAIMSGQDELTITA